MTGMDRIRRQRGMMAKISAELGLTRAAVNNWKRVPAERLPDVERITGLPRHILRPDICHPPIDIGATIIGAPPTVGDTSPAKAA